MVSACSDKVPRVSSYSGYRHAASPFAYGALTLYGLLSQNSSARISGSFMRSEPRGARTPVWALPGCFSSPGSPHNAMDSRYDHMIAHMRFPYSDISGSWLICSFPELFAAYHVFRRLLVPRHPPCALLCLIISDSSMYSVTSLL